MATPDNSGIFKISPQEASQWTPVSNDVETPDDTIDYSSSGADFIDRTNTQNFFDTPETQSNYLKGIGYETMPAEAGNIAVRRPGAKWGVLDPSGFSPKELGAELLTNLDIPVQGMARTPGVGALIGGGYEGLRQWMRQGLDPNAPMEPGKIALNAAVGGAAPYMANKLFGAPGAVVDKAKSLAGEAGDAISSAASKISPGVVDEGKGVLSKGYDWVKNLVAGPDAVTRDISVSPKSFKQVGVAVTDAGEPDTLNTAVKYLQKNSPEFNSAMNNWTAKGKADAINAEVKRLGPKVGEVYESLPPVSGKTIMGSKDFTTLESLANGIDPVRGVAVPETTQKAFAKIYGEQIDQLAKTFLSPSDLARWESGELAKTPKLLGTEIVDEIEALKYILQTKNIKASDAAALKMVWEDAAKFDTSGDIAINQARKLAAGANREAVDSAISRLSNETAKTEAQTAVDSFHHLARVQSSLDDVQSMARQTGAPPIGKALPSTIASVPRRVLQMGQKIANSSLTRNIAGAIKSKDGTGLGGFLQGAKEALPDGSSMGGMAGPIAETIARGVGYDSLKKVADKQTTTEAAYADEPTSPTELSVNGVLPQNRVPPANPALSQVLQQGAQQQPTSPMAPPDPFVEGLPRDTNQWNMQAVNRFAKYALGKSPEVVGIAQGLAKKFGDALHQGDKGKLQRIIADMAKLFPDAFVPGMGIDDKLFHPDDQAEYLDTLLNGVRKGTIEPSFLARQRDSFLNKNDSAILPVEQHAQQQFMKRQNSRPPQGNQPRQYSY